MHENGNRSEPAARAGVSAPKHSLVRRVLTGLVVAPVAVLGLSLVSSGAASAATPSSHGGGSSSGTWDQTKVPLPHLPGQGPVFLLQSQTVADVVALDQTSEDAARASLDSFYANNTACTVKFTLGPGDIDNMITCPHGSATSSLALDFSTGTWFHVFRAVK